MNIYVQDHCMFPSLLLFYYWLKQVVEGFIGALSRFTHCALLVLCHLLFILTLTGEAVLMMLLIGQYRRCPPSRFISPLLVGSLSAPLGG